ncbi:MAG: hypothetical protein IPI60_18055 [Saprospiraceae bacterium]|nr:hypothetical protein [Saprospiraceae bacterium]
MRLLFRYVRVDADAADILNKGMLKVFLKIEQFGGNEDNFFGWIKRVVINEALDHLRAGNKLSNAEPIDNIPEKTELNLAEEKDATQMMQFLLVSATGSDRDRIQLVCPWKVILMLK